MLGVFFKKSVSDLKNWYFLIAKAHEFEFLLIKTDLKLVFDQTGIKISAPPLKGGL